MYIDKFDNAPVLVAAPVPPLREYVNTGQLSIDQEAGETLRRALLKRVDELDSWFERVRELDNPLPLGQNPVGEAMSKRFQLGAAGDEASLAEVLSAYQKVLEQTREAVNAAIRNVEIVDQATRSEFAKLEG